MEQWFIQKERPSVDACTRNEYSKRKVLPLSLAQVHRVKEQVLHFGRKPRRVGSGLNEFKELIGMHSKEERLGENDGKPVDMIDRIVRLEGALDDEQRAKLIEIAEKCPVHRTLTNQININTLLG